MAATPAFTPKRRIGRREMIVLLASLMALNALAIDAMLPAIDDIAHELGGADGNRRQLVIGVYMVATGVGCLVPGSFADRFGRRPIVLLALIMYALLSLLTAFLENFTAMLIVRGITGIFAAGLMVTPQAIVRDRFEGDQMARIMSLVSAVFITVPVVAPTLGQGILFIAGWRWIFALLAFAGAATAVWVYFRMPETLTPENRQEVNLPLIVRNMQAGLINRAAIGYVVGASLVVGGVFGYVNSAQQLFQDNFSIGEEFPLYFGATAAAIAVSNIVNSRIVTSFGARRVSHAGVLVFVAVSALQVWSSYEHPGDVRWFLPMMATNLMLLGFLGANFGSIAMQPFAQIAGAASSVQTFVRMLGASLVGIAIGQSYNGTAQPFAWALLISSLLALAAVLFSEKGRLFRRLNPPGPRERLVP